MTNEELQSLQKRVQRLEAIEAIKQLKARYLSACDSKQLTLIRDCFAEGEIDIDYGAVGCFRHRDELLALFDNVGNHQHMVEMHHGQNPRITLLDEEQAEGEWGLYYFLINSEENTLTQLGGVYADRYRLIDGQWRITASQFTPTSTLVSQLEQGQAEIMVAGRPPQSVTQEA
ncbi:SnoaL-like protein [Sinobacterium caligoides]|uniref:SnoaL-like protein n=2 Tax=Sinobacterium caligoides TaxID=933926 RepID=A0A3N2D4Q4_9GAMM|nr:SnoaL-like protein [Sinobacterium caligoides]